MAGIQNQNIDERDGETRRNADDVVPVIALERINNGAKYRKRELDAEVCAGQKQDLLRRPRLTRLQVEEPFDVPGDEGGDDQRDRAQAGKQQPDRAHDFVQRSTVSPRTVLGDEFDQGAAVTEVENAEEPGDRCRQRPESISGRTQMRNVEGQ